MADFETTAQAFHAARARASIAADIETQTLHMAIYDAREVGMSVRETAAALRVPKSTISRHWREGHRCNPVPPVWGNAEEYLTAERAVWAHAPELNEATVPYEWNEEPDGGRSVRLMPPGAAVLREKAS